MSMLTSFDQEPSAKKSRLDQTSEDHIPLDHRVAAIIPVMAERFRQNVRTYKKWIQNGFDVVLVVTEDEKKSIFAILEKQQDPLLKETFVVHNYTPGVRSNAGTAKNAAFDILRRYLDDTNFMYAVLLDDTVDDLTDTKKDVFIMISPSEFCKAVEKYAGESPIFGGTVAAKRHPQRCAQDGIVPVKGAFLQQAIFFSCMGTPTLRNHFKDTNEYVKKMDGLSYRAVPFGEDVAFQISLYENGVLKGKKSAQFWGIGVSRTKHKSVTKRPFNELEHTSKEALKKMIIYLRDQDALRWKCKIDARTKELTGIKVIPGGAVRIRIKGKPRERPWREAFNYTFPHPGKM